MPNDGPRLRKGAAGSRAFTSAFWIATAWAAFVIVPWHGIEGGLYAVLAGRVRADQLASAIRLAFEGHPRLLLLLIPLALATVAEVLGRPRLLVAAGLLGIGWVVFDGFFLSGRGTLGTLADRAGRPRRGAGLAGLGRPAFRRRHERRGKLRLGAARLAEGRRLHHRGADPGQRVDLHFRRLSRAMHSRFGVQEQWRGRSGRLCRAITDSAIWGLGCLPGGTCGVAWNSLMLAVIVGVLSTALGLAFALVAVRTRFPFPKLFRRHFHPAGDHAALRHRPGADPPVRAGRRW